MNQPPLNPDALDKAADAVNELYADGHCPKAEDAAEVAVSAYVAAALPEVTSVEELEALPVGSLVKTADGREFYKAPLYDYPWSQGREHDRANSPYLANYGPVTILHKPKEKP